MGIVVVVLFVGALTFGFWGAFFMLLAEPDERFDEYSAARRRASKRAGPWMLGGGAAILAVLGVVALLG